MSHDISRGFAGVDRTAAPESFTAFLDVVDALPAFRADKRRPRTLLRLAPGQVAQIASFAWIPLDIGDFLWVRPWPDTHSRTGGDHASEHL